MMKIDLDVLESNRDKASEDKCDLFDFYNSAWGLLIQHIKDLRAEAADLRRELSKSAEECGW